MPIVSLRKYGSMRGVSGEAVRKAIKTGRLVNAVRYNDKGQPCVDVEVADREWVKNTDGSKQSLLDPEHRLSANAHPPGVTDDDEAAVSKGGVPAIHKSKAITEAYKARLAKLEFEEKSGKLIDAEKVRLEQFTAGRMIRDAIMSVPDRISAKLASITDPHTVHRELHAELVAALDRIIRDAS